MAQGSSGQRPDDDVTVSLDVVLDPADYLVALGDANGGAEFVRPRDATLETGEALESQCPRPDESELGNVQR
jgi:hypothetical protein